MIRVIFSLFLLSISINTIAQNPIADFSVKSTVCLNENLLLTNTSSNANTFLWDICQGDLALIPSVKHIRSLMANIPQGIDIVFDGSDWFGFVANQNGNSVLRIDFGSDLSNENPLVVDLGNFNNQLTSPGDIKIVNEHDMWYGFVYGLSGSILSRINFGSSLKNTYAEGVDITSLKSGGGSSNSGLDVIKTGSTWRLLYTLNNSVFVVNLPTLSSLPQSSDFFSGIELPGATLGDIVALEHNQNYFAYTVSFGNQTAYSISFGNEITNVSTTQDLGISFSGNLPYGIDAGLDNGNHMLFISTLSGNLFRVNLGESPTVSPISSSNLTNFSVLENTLKVALVKNKSTWFAFTPSWSSSRLYRVDFPNPTCSIETVSQVNPIVQFATGGKKAITLTASENGLNHMEKTIVINVENKLAPSINWQNTGVCKGNTVTFSADSPSAQNYAWKVDGVGFSTVENPTSIYNTTGTYFVELLVSDAQGCDNYLGKELTIYDLPNAVFSLPTGLICTNNEFTFVNTTADNFDGNLTYKWLVDDVPISTQRDLLFTFTSGGEKKITLQASIPGCSSETSQILPSVSIGSIVDFTISGKCQNETISFNSNSSGDIQSYAWDFGNGQSSSVLSPSIAFSNAGNYMIQLAATATNGCVSTKRIQHKVFQIPQTDFTIELPPFSCSGSPTQFTDLTPTLVDSNLSGWLWNFNDGGVTASSQNPQHTYMQSGQYNVSLLLTSDQGCSNQLTKAVTIAPSPSPSIQNSPSCINTGVEIWDGSAVTAADWQWRIGNSFYFNERPIHVFANPGSYQISLIATATNGCVATVFKNVMVPAAIDVDFTFSKNCVNSETLLTAESQAAADPIQEYLWTLEGEQRFGQVTAFEFLSSGQKEASLAVKTVTGCNYGLTKFINIFPGPVANFSASQLSGPPPLNVQFTNLSTAATSFEWKFNDGTNASSTLNAPSFSFTEIGDYPVDLRARNEVGCEDVATQLVRVAFPSPAVSLLDFSAEETIEGLIQLSTRVSNSGNVDYENLIFEITLSNNTRFQEIVQTPLLRGQTKDIELTTRIASTSSLEFICIQLLLPENSPEAVVNKCIPISETTNFRVPYPNPTNEKLFVDWIASEGQIVSLTLINLQGLEKVSMDLISDQGLNSFILPVQSLAPGLYFLRMNTGAKAQVFRFLIQ